MYVADNSRRGKRRKKKIVVRSETDNISILKYEDDTCIIGCIANDSDLVNNVSEVDKISNQYTALEFLLNPS